MQKLKKSKSICMVMAMMLMFMGGFVTASIRMQRDTEQKISSYEVKAAEMQETGPVADAAEKEIQMDVSLDIAGDLLKEMPDKPLLREYAKKGEEEYGDGSLENIINDINASKVGGAREAIIRVCEEAGIDVKTATVKDLTAEQIAEIDQAVYEVSDHPKD